MGLFGKLTSNDSMTGYKKFDNAQGWSNADLFAKLSGVTTSLGAPKMGSVKILGNEVAAVIYDGVSDTVDIYVKADDKKIDIGSAPKPGATGDAMLNALGAAFGGGSDEDSSRVNRAIEELQGVMDNLLAGREVTETASAAHAASGSSVKLYMEEKLELSLKDRYALFTADHEPAFFIEGNVMDTAYKIMDAQENEIMVVKKKLIAIMPEYSVFEGRREIASFKKKLKLTKTEIIGKVGGRELTIKGDMFAYNFDILLGDETIGTVDTELTAWGNCYRIESFSKSNVNIIVAIAAIVEALKKADERSSD